MTTSTECNNACFGVLFNALDILVAADCITPATSFSLGDDDGDDDGDDFDDDGNFGIAESFGAIAAFKTIFTGVCARSSTNNEYCGNLATVLEPIVEGNGTVTADTCTTIVGFGKCLGTLINAFEAVPIEGIPSTTFTALGGLLDTQCQAAGVTGVAQAAAGTEAPATASSSATGLTALLGATVLAAVAALLA